LSRTNENRVPALESSHNFKTAGINPPIEILSGRPVDREQQAGTSHCFLGFRGLGVVVERRVIQTHDGEFRNFIQPVTEVGTICLQFVVIRGKPGRSFLANSIAVSRISGVIKIRRRRRMLMRREKTMLMLLGSSVIKTQR
jgi:hypothetical protein